ncbi:MAG: AIR synthase-related protein [Candidatus Bathyarchaeota archaeon]|nr:AIR synthase-related protein [Candidatus Bathyarchaeota archaeon]MDH5495781.1 AIR synthase-related protein [Candidatus Bathyarchaeota archaeon]
MIEVGKLATEELKKLLRCIKKHPKVIIPPAPGFDSGVQITNENECLVVSTDPCIGVPEKWFGWLLIHYAASDVALFGAKPEFCTITLLGPPSTKANTFIKIMEQVCAVADELNMTVVTGHTGTYDGLSTLVGTCTAYGTVSKDRLITPGGARAGDHIICTKQIGLETVVNFVLTHEALAESLFDVARTYVLQSLVNMQTCVKEAYLLAEVGGVHAMHDITEGGLVAALNEMAESSSLGFAVDLEKLPILEEALILQKYFGLSQRELLSISSTGTLLTAIDPERKDQALQELLKHGIDASFIGTFTKNKKRLIQHGKKKTVFPKTAEDPYAKIMLK